jgi:flagellin
MKINPTNIGIINQMSQLQRSQQTTNAQLASGNRLVNAGVDAAGLSIANKMIAQLSGFNQADRNVQDGISMMRTAEGGLAGIGDMTIRINELTVQAANDTLTSEQRGMIQAEIDQLTDEISQVVDRTQFNTKQLLDGSLSEANGGAWIQSGPNAGQGTRFTINSMTPGDLGLDNISVMGNSGQQISESIGALQGALSAVTGERSTIGAYINRMESTSSAIGIASENLAQSISRIADTDMAKAMINSIQNDVLQQTSILMLRNMMQNQQLLQGGVLRALGI